MICEFEGIWKEAVSGLSEYYPGIYLEVLGQITEILSVRVAGT
jgi:hypothetical protein